MIVCSMTPTQDSLADIFRSFALAAAQIKQVGLTYLAEARKALANGDVLLYNTLYNQYADQITQFENYVNIIDTLLVAISPMPLSGSGDIFATISDVQKGWVTKAKGIVSDFTMYLPQKFLELITSVLPVSLEVPIPIIGNVDIIQFFNNESYRNDLKVQVVSNLSAFPSAIYGMYSGIFDGVVCLEMQAQEVWAWVCQQISTGGMKLLHDAFTALIKQFKTIWDSLGLPSLPALLTLDVEGLILAAIEAANGVYSQVIDNLMALTIFGIPLSSLLNIRLDTATVNVADIISDIISQAKDFANNYVLNIFLDWMGKVKSFFNAIGLGAIIAFITFDFCDFLSLIGLNLP